MHDPQHFDTHREMLLQARQRTRALLAHLLHQQADLDAHVAMVPAQTMHEGRTALEGAIDSARRMLESIETALQNALRQENSQPTT